jgi:hypothetical protein
MLPSVLAVGAAVAVAWWSWRDRLDQRLARRAALARAAGLAALFILVLDPGIANRRVERRPFVLLDNSVSMHAAGGRAAEAARVAASIGDTTSFGELTRGEPGGRSNLLDALTGAVASGRPIAVVTDGEIADVAAIPGDLLARATVRLLPRPAGADVALTAVRAPLRLAAGDTLTIEVEAERTAGAPDSASVLVRDSASVWLRGVLRFGASSRTQLHLAGPLPRGLRGEQWLRVERIGAADAEPEDDVRWWRLTVTPTPGVVVVADAPDWDARALYRTLKDVVDVPIRGYAQLQRGQWRRMDDLRPVAASEVTAAAKGADLLAVRGDVKGWRAFGKARLLWPAATESGDWYVTGGGVSPINGAFAGVEPDSLPPAAGVRPLDGDSLHGWVGATARRSRRGPPVPVIGGAADRTGRTIVIGVDGLYRWAERGGVADQAWRTMIASAASWLLATPEGDSTRARPLAPVTQRGRPVHFRWTGTGAPLPVAIELRGPLGDHRDTLRFDGAGDAVLAVGVGRYRYTLDGGGTGTFAVEPYSDELAPSPVTLTEHAGLTARAAQRRSLRELLWLFGIAIAGFGSEWMLRRRLGLR